MVRMNFWKVRRLLQLQSLHRLEKLNIQSVSLVQPQESARKEKKN